MGGGSISVPVQMMHKTLMQLIRFATEVMSMNTPINVHKGMHKHYWSRPKYKSPVNNSTNRSTVLLLLLFTGLLYLGLLQ